MKPAIDRREACQPVRMGSAPAMGAAAKAAKATGGVTVEITAKKTTKRCNDRSGTVTVSMPDDRAMTIMK